MTDIEICFVIGLIITVYVFIRIFFSKPEIIKFYSYNYHKYSDGRSQLCLYYCNADYSKKIWDNDDKPVYRIILRGPIIDLDECLRIMLEYKYDFEKTTRIKFINKFCNVKGIAYGYTIDLLSYESIALKPFPKH
ncbi:gp85 [Sphingomonas phage PAU]|uniref:gp85 n=1 Tax=Sphingomonas phage PAU TaxID=1150991 RepID=UPI00025731DF|nr:gp85 [Sphingomonas phage PAU]AFF28083.1 gp85 [Sphingomonas phage PAU]